MRPTLASILLVLTLLVPAATVAADYREGSTLEADAPVRLAGRVDALVAQGHGSLISSDGRAPLEASLTAAELSFDYVSATSCTLGTSACRGVMPAESQGLTLTDATLRVTRVLQPYKVLVSNQASLSSPIVATTGGAETRVDATTAPLYLSPYADGWSADEPQALTDHVYTAAADEAAVLTRGGTLRAAHDFELLLQGVEVEIKGTDPSGAPYSGKFQTGRTSSGGGTRYEFIVAETRLGVFNAVSEGADIAAYQVRAVDLPRGKAEFTGATGTIRSEGGTTEYDRAPVTLAGPLELVVSKVVRGDPSRLAFAVSSNLRVLADAPIPDPKDANEPLKLAAAGAAGAGGAALFAAAVFYWPRLKFGLSALLLPMYTRIQRTEVLEHTKRDEIYSLIRSSPGIHAHEIGEKANIGWGTTVYHLKLLESHSLVVSKKSGRYKRFFVNTGEYTKKKDVYGALRNDTAKAVADYVVNHPGSSQKDLCATLGIQPSLASWHVQRLEQVGLVKRVRDGRQVRYYAGDAWGDLNVRADPAAAASDGVAET